MSEEIYKAEKSTARGDDINLKVYVNIVDEKNASPEQKQAAEKVRKIYAEWIEEITVTRQ